MTTVSPEAADATTSDLGGLAPGVTVFVRDEEWLVTSVARSTDGWMITARGLSDYVRDHTATFYTALDTIEVFDPAKVTVVPDTTNQFRRSRLWVETVLRQTPIPMGSTDLAVSKRMLVDPLDYQLEAVRKALSPKNVRPRVLIADAVGLGKTLEMGMILSELIRRGRGERILVVTPRHVMEQFQQEMWTRFALPLVRLDSVGIQKVRQKLPASRNPFTYFPRVIVSMDTIKSPKYRAQLEKVRWDAVVIDEIHNATNVGTQNNELARVLAPTTESLILASATPHNGDPESFKEILRLLDPTAVHPDGKIAAGALERLIIRRHRNSPEVAQVVGEKWAKRAEPKNIPVEPYPEETAVAEELAATWISPADGRAVCKDRLFPWTLVKSFLSSPAALQETLEGRIKRLGDSDPTQTDALNRLLGLTEQIDASDSGKYRALVEYLQDIGISKKSNTRVVVFSERVRTLEWLKENLAKDLKLGKGAVEVMHGGLTDQEQMRLIDDFKRSDSPIRILVTGDVASEGVNLHAQCHHLVHFDIPWSLIRIQQRNGRIDRYGQREEPHIATLLLDPDKSSLPSEIKVLTRLMDREHEAHETLGDASSLMGKHSVTGEEEAIRDVLRGNREFEEVVKSAEELKKENDSQTTELMALLGLTDAVEVAESEAVDAVEESVVGAEGGAFDIFEGPADTADTEPSLYRQEIDYLREALREAFHEVPSAAPSAGGVGFEEHSNGVAELEPPQDLRRRFDYLPQDYLAYRKVKERVTLATNRNVANQSLTAAREGNSESTWPKAHFLGPLHPVTQWAADRALSSLGKREIPAVVGAVDSPTVLLLGTLTNQRGQVIARSLVTAQHNAFGMISAEPLADGVAWLESIGLGADAVNSAGASFDEDEITTLIADAVTGAQDSMAPLLIASADDADHRIADWMKRVEEWEASKQGGQRSLNLSERAISEERSLALSLAPDRDRKLVRPILVVLPENSAGKVN